MPQISSDILSLSGEPAVLARHGRLIFANPPALAVLGEDSVGKSVRSVFGAEISGIQAPSFVADALLGGRQYIVRASSQEGLHAFFLSSHEAPPAVLTDALLYSLRSGLMTANVALELARQLAEEDGGAELLRQLACVTQSVYRIRRAISNVSLIRSVYSGTQFFSARSFDLRLLLVQLADGVSSFAPDPPLLVAAGAPVPVTADPVLLEQLILNLISNCLTHAHGCTRLNLDIIESGDTVALSVSDDGCGIPPEGMTSVLDRYRHGFNMDELGKGAGLGLTVVRSIARLHGGMLMLESRFGAGTTVRVSMDRHTAPLSLHEDLVQPVLSASDLLSGLADCLPSSCFREKFTD